MWIARPANSFLSCTGKAAHIPNCAYLAGVVASAARRHSAELIEALWFWHVSAVTTLLLAS